MLGTKLILIEGLPRRHDSHLVERRGESIHVAAARPVFHRNGCGQHLGALEAWADVDSTQVNARRLYPRLCRLFLSD